MKNLNFSHILNTYVVPSLVIALGTILLIHPDTASVLIANLIGWILVICSGGAAAAGLRDRGEKRTAKLVCALGALCGGIWLLNHPLVLATALGRFLGAMLLYWGGRDVWSALRLRRAGQYTPWPILATIIAAVGLILFFLPMSASRLVFRVTGLIVAALGISELIRRLKQVPYLQEGNDPDIIDAL
jgi:uncharacterized membrane protein HdeD (DUF308 family)